MATIVSWKVFITYFQNYPDGIRGAIADWKAPLGPSNGTVSNNNNNKRTSICRFAEIGSGIGMIMTKSGLSKSEKDLEGVRIFFF